MKTLLAKLLGITTGILAFFLPVLRELLATGIATLLPLALDIVRDLNTQNIPSSAKRAEAIKLLTAAAIRHGLVASESLIRLALETAVTRLKAQDQ
jgi:hypothetical protein